ncbi:MAG: sulfotransferase [Alphaproteobacteria bacterium]|nr:sulfotransferase [Alphaproteobacteria bacterium]
MAREVPGPVGTLSAALANAAKLLKVKPAFAEEQAREILKAAPGNGQALLLLGSAQRRQRKTAAAVETLKLLAETSPKSAPAQFEYGLALAEAGQCDEAIDALHRAVALEPGHASAWRELGDQKALTGDDRGAAEAYAHHIQASANDQQLRAAGQALCENRLAVAEHMLRAFLRENPTDVSAIRMLAETGSRLGRYEDAEHLLARCVELAPGFTAARHNYASVLYRQNKPLEAIAQADILLKDDPRNPGHRALKAAALGQIGEYARAVEIYENLLATHPGQPKAWMSYGHALKALGRHNECVAAYRKSIALLPSLGEAYWSLANLKTFRFTDQDVAAMRDQLARSDIADEDRYHLDFALGKAFEDAGKFDASFQHYEKGNALRRAGASYDAGEFAEHVQRLKAQFTAEFLRDRSAVGCNAPDPIFIVGLPRAGSTLLEQILSSHSAIEGTMELPDIIAIARRLGGKKRHGEASAYPSILNTLDRGMFAALGEEYLARTRIHRKLSRPYFIDKMPNNFVHVGLIHLILPNAKIIDARRHPLGCCLSCFKQHFARGQAFTYSLDDIGRYYASYVELMAHYDAVLPGRVHRVIYERLVADPEAEVRRLLAYCGLPFEDRCLRFYENERAVRTASSEQVRQPIFKDAVEHWQNFEPWLEPLKSALGLVLEPYPAAPTF